MKKLTIFAALFAAMTASACAQQNTDTATTIDPRAREELRRTARDTAREMKKITTEFKQFYADLKDIVREEGIADLGEEPIDSAFGRTDITDEEREMVVKMDMPGVKKDQITVKLINATVLKVEAQREVASDTDTDGVVRSERHKGSFVREFKLPHNAAEGGFKAELSDGVLTARIPKEKPSTNQVRNIPVS